MKITQGVALAAATLVVGLALGTSASLAGQCGRASWYALHSRTASGERMNPSALTAAHRSLPFGTRLKVTNRNNGRVAVVRINDRGPFARERIIDLSKGAAEAPGAHRQGVVPVRVRRVEPSDKDRARLRKGKPAAALAPLPPRELAALRARLAAGER